MAPWTWCAVEFTVPPWTSSQSLSSWPAPGTDPRHYDLGSTSGTHGFSPRVKGGSVAAELTERRRCPPVGGAP
jgi:hypothetical protein